MRPLRVRLKGISTAFKDRDVTVDLAALGEGVFAIVGENGAGKTTLMEAMGPAVLFRKFPSYAETFAAHVPPGERAAVVELEFAIGGETFRAVVQADPLFGGGRGKTEALLYRREGPAGAATVPADGPPDPLADPNRWTPIAGPLVKDFDEAIARLVPSEEVFLASVFACQGGGGSFFNLQKAARRDLFAEMLGIARLQAMAVAASGEAKTLADGSARDRDRLDEMVGRRARRDEIDAALARLTAAEADLARARIVAAGGVTTARAAREIVIGDLARIEASATAFDARAADLDRRITADEAEVVALDGEDARLRALADRKADVATADVALRDRRRDLDGTRKVRDAIVGDLAELDREIAEARAMRDGAEAKRADLEERLLGLRADRERVAEGAALESDLRVARETLASLQADRPTFVADIERAEGRAVKARETRERRAALEAERGPLDLQRAALGNLEDPENPLCGRCPLTAEARTAETRFAAVDAALRGIAAGGPLDSADEGVRAARVALADLDKGIGSTELEIARLEANMAAVQEAAARIQAVPEIEAGLDWNSKAARGAEARRAGAEARATDLRARLAAVDEDLRGLTEAVTAAETLLRDRDAILGAAERLAGTEARRAKLRADLEAERTARTALGDRPDPGPVKARLAEGDRVLAAAETAVAEAERAGENLAKERAEAEAERAEIERVAGDAAFADVEKRAASATREIADWTLLARALGREGVQALKIDAAGPEVAALANDLLRSCGWGRFQLSLETQAARKSGEGMKEIFEVRILDALADREARRGSGGEMVILDEALRLAFAIFNARRSGTALRTLWRDETVGALSAENASRYLAMLRRAREIGGFETVFFVAHQRETWEQADGFIFITPAAVEVQREGGDR